ncbi:syntaxin-like protein [Phytophthora cinnamomi]|uniref:syntaxin-like protein n=1 Tax=Phytophthora cinnamomi TaxID=4785 RepID=UPI00355A9149|nr:syntaxin-like protein [Phytophthora cinnamomi]
MAYRDLTSRFQERRANLRKRNLRFRMRPRLDNSPLLGALFLSKQVAARGWVMRLPNKCADATGGVELQRAKSHAMEKALLQDAREFPEGEHGDV